MKPLTTYTRVSAYLVKIFDLLNAQFFESQLSKPMITIQSAPGMAGRYSRDDAWSVDDEDSIPEINISAESLSMPIEYVVAALLHEMVHYDLDMKGIQSCSRSGTYHNKQFRDRAEECGLIVNKTEKNGWSETLPSDELLRFCVDNGLTEIRLCKVASAADEPKRNSSSRKYVCPGCGAIVRATSEVNIMCLDCNAKLTISK